MIAYSPADATATATQSLSCCTDAQNGLVSRKRYKIDTYSLLKSNRKSYALYRMVTLPMTLSAP